MSIWERIERANPRYLYLVVGIGLALPLIAPIPLPLHTNRIMTMPVYRWIEDLAPGDLVFVDVSYNPYAATELTPQLKAWFAHCMKKGLKVVGLSQMADGAPIGWNTLSASAGDLESEGIQARYGSDWVFVGWRAGGMEIIRAMQTDFWSATGGVDYQGRSFQELPLMASVKAWDADTGKGVMVFGAGSTGVSTYFTYFPGYPVYQGSLSSTVVNDTNYLRSGQIKGLLSGMRGAAEYENLVKRPGAAISFMGSQTIGHVILILLIGIGNIAYFRRKGGRR